MRLIKPGCYCCIVVFLILQSFLLLHTAASPRQVPDKEDGFFSSIRVSGDLQTDLLYAQTDTVIGAFAGDNPLKSNSYLRLLLSNQYIEAGARTEYMKNPLPGFETGFAGAGIANLYLRVRYKGVDITAGDFYEQFGTGLILRTYEDRALGLDNSIRGSRVVVRPFSGLTVKVLGGSQRFYFQQRRGALLGANVEMSLDEWVQVIRNNDYLIRLEASFVDKYEPDEVIMYDADYRLNLPKYVPAASGKLSIQKGAWDVMMEYARKWNDPSVENNYSYKNGSALLISGSYSRRGFSVLAQARRSDNMSYRSIRSIAGSPLALTINYLSPFTLQHTYTLAAIYPYATQKTGEWAFQTEWRYKAKRNTLMGGDFGTDFHLSFSHIRPLYDSDKEVYSQKGLTGYQSSFFETGNELLFQDLTVELSKKVNPIFSFSALYMNLIYNQKVIEKKQNNGAMVYSNIFITDMNFKLSNTLTLRSELQYLYTRQDQGNWIAGVLELSMFPGWMIALSDLYNSGLTKVHYPRIIAGFTHHAHRLQLGYGRTREGMNCSGGICRLVPASKGWSISYNLSF